MVDGSLEGPRDLLRVARVDAVVDQHVLGDRGDVDTNNVWTTDREGDQVIDAAFNFWRDSYIDGT